MFITSNSFVRCSVLLLFLIWKLWNVKTFPSKYQLHFNYLIDLYLEGFILTTHSLWKSLFTLSKSDTKIEMLQNVQVLFDTWILCSPNQPVKSANQPSDSLLQNHSSYLKHFYSQTSVHVQNFCIDLDAAQNQFTGAPISCALKLQTILTKTVRLRQRFLFTSQKHRKNCRQLANTVSIPDRSRCVVSGVWCFNSNSSLFRVSIVNTNRCEKIIKYFDLKQSTRNLAAQTNNSLG